MKKNLISVLIAAVMAAMLLSGCSEVSIIGNDGKKVLELEDERDEDDDEKEEASLEYWSEDSSAAASIKDYVERVTDEDSKSFIPEEDRIAVFDLDGTIVGELCPTYFETMMFIHRALYDDTFDAADDMKEYAKAYEKNIEAGKQSDDNDGRYAKYVGEAYAGMTPDELKAYTKEFMKSKAEGFNNLTRGDAFFKPMVSLVEYLDANGFQCYIVSGSDRTVCRALIEDRLPIPANRVIGKSYTMVATGQGDTDGIDYVYQPDDEVVLGSGLIIQTLKMNKVSEIALEIGKTPVLAFGNSSGDLSMCQYTVNNKDYESKAYLVLCDDTEREYGDPGKAASLAEFCESHEGMETISMAMDFATIYGDDVTLDPERENQIFNMKLPAEVADTAVVLSRRNGYSVFEKEAYEAGFGGHAFSVSAYEEPSEYAGGMSVKVGEIRDGEKTLYDIVVDYPSDVQFDYSKYDAMPEDYERLYRGAEDIIKGITVKDEGEFVWGAGCEGDGMYDEILEKYVTAIDEEWDASKLEEEEMSPEYYPVSRKEGKEALKEFGYAYRDTNNDGIDELLIGRIEEGDLKGVVYDIYTMVDRKPAHVVSGSARDSYFALENGMLVNIAKGGADETDYITYYIEANTTELLQQLAVKEDGYENKEQPYFAAFGIDSDWENITKEEFDDYMSRIVCLHLDFTPLADVS
ncbi:MAG: haloacid dehalogenase-like hydrolase [Lachnospiraceae bacterium]|nr:haloacid dehalogenase-like hydrolase [Lachnospiraceae bacterium]